jgi:hypothetical protein
MFHNSFLLDVLADERVCELRRERAVLSLLRRLRAGATPSVPLGRAFRGDHSAIGCPGRRALPAGVQR